MAVKSKSFGDAALTHHSEAHSLREAEILLTITAQEVFRLLRRRHLGQSLIHPLADQLSE